MGSNSETSGAFRAELSVSRLLNPYAAFALALCVAALVYLPGLHGPFLFDDYPNLEPLGARGPIRSFELLHAYLKSGFAGPLGRPLSLLSFLIDANNWPAEAWPFKRTNLIIHLLVGAVLCGTTRALLIATGRSRQAASWIGVLAASYWLLNPFLVSTTLYAVQRMTQLAALFVLAGVWCYVYGRSALANDHRRGYIALSVGVPVFTVLAALSKENGALLPLLLLVIHWVFDRRWSTRPSRWWTAAFLVLPSVALVGYVLYMIPNATAAYSARDFTMYERALSQARFIWDYLYHFFIPHIQTQGLFQDGRAISTGLLDPWTTLPAVLGIITLAVSGFASRTRWPLTALSILFFFAGHLLESTIVPLELYFEHRNYLPAAFLFLPIASALYDSVLMAPRAKVAAFLIVVTLTGYSAATWQHAKLWGDEDALLLVWAHTNPRSTRAQVAAAQTWVRNNQPEKALALLEQARKNQPDSALVVSNELYVKAELGRLTLSDLSEGAQRIREGTFDAQAIRALEQLVYIVNSHSPLPEHAQVIDGLLQGIRKDLGGKLPPVTRMTFYLQGLLAAGQGHGDEALEHFVQALQHYGSVDPGMRMVSDLARFQHFRQALELLSRCQTLLERTPDAQLKVSRQTFLFDMGRVRSALLDDLEKQQRNASQD